MFFKRKNKFVLRLIASYLIYILFLTLVIILKKF